MANDYWTKNQIHKNQFAYDIESLYGALLASIKCTAGKNQIAKFQTKQDGLSCWIALVKEYETGANADNTKATLEDELNTPIHNRYKGGSISLFKTLH